MLLGALMTGLQVSATTYYVDFASGSNTNSGTSASAAWKHAPGDANATGNPAIKALVAGDTVLFKGGVQYVGEIIFKWSGSSSSPISYDGTTWNGTAAILTTNNASDTTAMSDEAGARSHLIIRGLRFQNIGGYTETDPIWSTTAEVTAPPSGVGIRLDLGSSNIVIEDCKFAEIGQWQNKIPMSGINSVTGTGVSLVNNTGVLVTGCDFTRMRCGVSVKATTTISDISIVKSTFHNSMNWLIDLAPRKAGAILRDITIDGCTLFDYKEFDSPNWQGYGEKPHQDGIFLRTASMASTWENIQIKNTTFYSDQTSGGGTASIYLSQGASADISNCRFLNDQHANAYINIGYDKVAGMTQRIRIWNCTFVGGSTAIRVPPGNANPDYIEIRNNVFQRTNAYQIISLNPADIGELVMDYNVYFAPNSARCINTSSTALYLTLASWQSSSGKDQNSVWADPGFVNIAGLASTWDLNTLSSNSPVALLKAGATFSTSVALAAPTNLKMVLVSP
jgi:hypothetical protein